jgi:hypothetical protein
LELTFTKSQIEKLKRAKEVLSHKLPQSNWSELFCELAEEFLKRKDLTRQKPKRDEVKGNSDPTTSTVEAAIGRKPIVRAYIPIKTKREIFQRDQCCQWRNKNTGKICGSKYLLQLDHIQPRWANGSNDRANLQLLCGIHNRLKYKQEVFQF